MSKKNYDSEILRYLLESGGTALRKDIQRELGIPKSSLTYVQKRLEFKGLIKVLPTFGNRLYWRITLKGKIVYQYGEGEISSFSIPKVVEKYLALKPDFKGKFFPLQNTFLERGLLSSNSNVAVFGPPSSGKTLIAEMCMIKEVSSGGKVLYGTPYKALDRQKYKNFHKTFSKMGYRVEITDGDNPSTEDRLENADIIIATFERIFGALSAGERWLKKITLLCADEITLLGEDRGAILDSLLTEFIHSRLPRTRIITLSSDVGNKFEIAGWLQAEPVIGTMPQDIEEFVVFKEGKNIVFWNKNGEKRKITSEKWLLEYIIEENLKRDETTLIFVPARRMAEIIAEKLEPTHKSVLKNANVDAKDIEEFLSTLEERTYLVQYLCDLLKSGVAFHHAGLPLEVRHLVEDLLDQRKIKTVVCTTTLSHGIDYPVDNVVILICGFERRWELDRYICVQLKGRAGRPSKSKGKGKVFLVTTKEESTQCMEKYVFGKPESIYPDTLTEDNLGRLILVKLSETDNQDVSLDEIYDAVSKTLAAKKEGTEKRVLERKINKIIKDLEKYGLLKSSNRKKSIQITQLGKFLNEINISPYDAQLVFKSLENIKSRKINSKSRSLEFGLLHLACSIDVARKVREEPLRSPCQLPRDLDIDTIVDQSLLETKEFVRSLNKALILLDWINEVNLNEITQKYPFYDDYDVIQLGTYAARSLLKISKIAEKLEMKKIAEKAKSLSARVRYGVKDDLVKTELIYLHGIGRKRARLLYKKGFTIDKLSKTKPRDLAKILGNLELSKNVIKEARRIRNEAR